MLTIRHAFVASVFLAPLGCSAEPGETTGTTESHFESCAPSNGFQVSGPFCDSFKKFDAPYPRVGVALTNAFSNGRGDTLQVFERVVMNLSPQAPCANGAACVAFTGIDDANETFHQTYDGRVEVGCDTAALGRRSFACLPGIFDRDPRVIAMRNEVQGNLSYYGYMISPVVPTCAWWNADLATPDHESCFWTERGKIGRAPGGAWEYEAVASKRMKRGQIPGLGGGPAVSTRKFMVHAKSSIQEVSELEAPPTGGDGPLFLGLVRATNFAYNEVPPDHLQSSGKFRLYGDFDVEASCADGKPRQPVVHFTTVAAGNEGPFQGEIDPLKLRVHQEGGSWVVSYVLSGRPNSIAEPAFQAIRQRSKRTIFQFGNLQVGCAGNTPTAKFDGQHGGTSFPSHRVWLLEAANQNLLEFDLVLQDRSENADEQLGMRGLWDLPDVPAP